MASQVLQAQSGRQQPTCWAGIARLFVGASSRRPALADRSREKAPSSSAQSTEDANAEAAFRSPEIKELNIKGPALFNKVAQLIVAAAFMLWRFAPVEEKGCGATGPTSSRNPLPVLLPKAATSLVALGPKEHSPQSKLKQAKSSTYGAAHLFVIVAVMWQASAVRYHALDFPNAIWLGGHDPQMSSSCSNLFEVARWSVFVAIAVFAAQVAVLIFLGASLAATLQAAPERIQRVLISTIRFMAGRVGSWLVLVWRTVFAAASLAALAHARQAECQACQSLTASVACSCLLFCTMTISDIFTLLSWMWPRADPEEAPFDPEMEPLLASKA